MIFTVSKQISYTDFEPYITSVYLKKIALMFFSDNVLILLGINIIGRDDRSDIPITVQVYSFPYLCMVA